MKYQEALVFLFFYLRSLFFTCERTFLISDRLLNENIHILFHQKFQFKLHFHISIVSSHTRISIHLTKLLQCSRIRIVD